MSVPKRRASSRRSRASASPSCTHTVATDSTQIQVIRKSGMRERMTAGTISIAMRSADAASEGIVLPSAWNMLDATKMIPEATKFHEMICRYTVPAPTTAGSSVKTRTIPCAHRCTAAVITSMNAEAISAASRNTARTRSGSRAPTFCPATGATAKPSATTGMKVAWMTRVPIPKPACSTAPNGRARV